MTLAQLAEFEIQRTDTCRRNFHCIAILQSLSKGKRKVFVGRGSHILRERRSWAETVAMVKVGLTGGIACGKTTILAMFAALGAHTLRADAVAHQLMAAGAPMYERIVATFGEGILALDGTIARAKLAAAAFPARIAELNAIVHPPVLSFEDRWMREVGECDPRAVAICEAALLIEAGGLARYDKLIVVTCSMAQKISRFAERTGLSAEASGMEVLRRMAAQIPEEDKAKMADFVIDNGGSREDVEQRVREVWGELTATPPGR
jgi:dephospho-CoA kinase